MSSGLTLRNSGDGGLGDDMWACHVASEKTQDGKIIICKVYSLRGDG